MSTNHTRGAAGGVTLIELLVALALVGIVLAAAGSLLLGAFSGETAYRQQNNVQVQARQAVSLVADDVKGAKRVATVVTVGTTKATLPTNTVVGYSGANIASHSAPLYCNIFDDAGNEKRVRYWLNGTDLRREVVAYVDETATPGAATGANGGIVVAKNVTTFTVQRVTFDSNALNPANYSLVRITVIATDAANAPLNNVGAPADPNTASQSRVTADVMLRNNLL